MTQYTAWCAGRTLQTSGNWRRIATSHGERWVAPPAQPPRTEVSTVLFDHKVVQAKKRWRNGGGAERGRALSQSKPPNCFYTQPESCWGLSFKSEPGPRTSEMIAAAIPSRLSPYRPPPITPRSCPSVAHRYGNWTGMLRF